MKRLVTFKRTDPEFMSYLKGTFSKNERAIAVRSFHSETFGESITFEVAPLQSLDRPALWKVWLKSLRMSHLIYSLFPVIFYALYFTLVEKVEIDLLIIAAVVGVPLLHLGLNLLNDYADHLSGLDRIHHVRGSRAIQKGWLAAHQVLKAAVVFIAAASICGGFILFQRPIVLSLVTLTALFLAFEFTLGYVRLRIPLMKELAVFLVTGPLLAAGFCLSLGRELTAAPILMGCIFGAFTLIHFHLIGWESLPSDELAGKSSWAQKRGFDGAKSQTRFVLLLPVLFHFGFWGLSSLPHLLIGLVLAVQLYLVSRRSAEIVSPFSSGFGDLRTRLRTAYIVYFALSLMPLLLRLAMGEKL